MVEKKITDLEIEAILEAFSKSQPIVTDRTGQSSSFRALFCFINLYVLLFIALYFLLKINQFADTRYKFTHRRVLNCLRRAGFCAVLAFCISQHDRLF